MQNKHFVQEQKKYPDVLSILEHRFPFIQVDRIIECKVDNEGRKMVVAEKFVSHNDVNFLGHFPNNPVMPGVLILEGMAQVAVCGLHILNPTMTKLEDGVSNKLPVFTGVDKVKFKSIVRPGDIMKITILDIRCKLSMFFSEAIATVEDKIVAEAIVKGMYVNPKDIEKK